ncbi:unnamed protein product [Penicillium bialowiezense]
MSQSQISVFPPKQPATTILPNAIPISFPRSPAVISKLPEFEGKLHKLAFTRSKLHEQKVGLLVRWESDDTDAENDLVTMESTLHQIGVKCTTYVIPSSKDRPHWDLRGEIFKLLDPIVKSYTHSLFVFYYAGQSELHDGDLCFTSGNKSISWFSISGILEAAEPVDTLAILDCGHANSASRHTTYADTNIHVIARCGTDEVTANRSNHTSFTQRVSHAMQKFKGQEKFTTTEWYQQMQLENPENAPHARFNDETSSRLSQPPPQPIYRMSPQHVLVNLTLDGQRDTDTLESFSRAICYLPANMEVQIRDASESDTSIFLLLRMSWEAWALWTSVVHLDFVGVALGPALLPLLPKPMSGTSPKQVLVKLTIDAQRGPDTMENFSESIRALPANMEVEILDAFESEASVFFLLRMAWDAWAQWTCVVHLDFVGVALGPALLPKSRIPLPILPRRSSATHMA